MRTPLLTIPLLALLAGCGPGRTVWDVTPRTATGLPTVFVPDTMGLKPGTSARGVEGCRTHLADPAFGTHLTLVRSTDKGGTPTTYWGDYDVSPIGRYGLNENELLRVDCRTGQAVGIVPRKD
jgi:hypothetical protein